MAKKAILFKGTQRKSRAEVSAFLAELSEKVASGEVILRQAQGDLVLELPASLQIKVSVTEKHKPVKGQRHKLTLSLTWYEGDQSDPLAFG